MSNVEFYETYNEFPATGEEGVLYVDKGGKTTYIYDITYVSVGGGSTLTLGETETTAYRGDRGKTAYDHSQSAHAPSNAQENVIESIKRNGVDLVVTNKSVNIQVPYNLDDINDVDLTKTKATPVDNDYVLLQDSADSSIWKRLSWSNIKTTLKTYFDTFYVASYGSGVAGEALTVTAKGYATVMQKSDGLIYMANATTSATSGVVGFITQNYTQGATATFKKRGALTISAHGFTVGSNTQLYQTTTNGTIGAKPSVNENVVQGVATATDANTIDIVINPLKITLYV